MTAPETKLRTNITKETVQYHQRQYLKIMLNKPNICTTVLVIDPVETLTVLLDMVYVGRFELGLRGPMWGYCTHRPTPLTTRLTYLLLITLFN